jgi:hypothetical protein
MATEATMSTPEVGKKARATTVTPAAQSVVIEVTKIDEEQSGGWYVYGYRAHRGSRPRQTMYPRLYFIAKEA